MAFNPILYESEEVGKRVKSSKIKHSWMLEISGQPYTVEFFDSRASKKARITLNDVEVFKGKRQGGEVNVPFRLGTLPASLMAKGATVDLMVGKRYFKHVWEEVKAAPVVERYDDFESDFPDDSPVKPQPQAPVQESQRPSKSVNPSAPIKEPQRPSKPVDPKPAPPVAPKAALERPKVQEAPVKPAVQTTDLLSVVFDAPVNPYPSAFDSPFDNTAPKAGPKEQVSSAPPTRAMLEDDFMVGETIKVKPHTAAPQQPAPTVVQPEAQLPSQMGPGMMPQAGAFPGQMGQNPWAMGQVPPNMMAGQMPPNMMAGQMPPNMMAGQMPPNMMAGQMPMMAGQMPPNMMGGQMPVMMGPASGMSQYSSQQFGPASGMPQYSGQQMGYSGMPYAPQSFATGLPQASYPVNPAAFASQGPASISSGLDFFTPHAGLIDPNPRLAKNDRFAPEAQVLQRGNPFADQKPDQSCVTDLNMLDLVDLNLSNPYTPAQHKQYKEHMRGVVVEGSDPDVPMKDLQKKGANHHFGPPAQGDFF